MSRKGVVELSTPGYGKYYAQREVRIHRFEQILGIRSSYMDITLKLLCDVSQLKGNVQALYYIHYKVCMYLYGY